jgi:hypothetical protein
LVYHVPSRPEIQALTAFESFAVPAGFETDLASIPAIVTPLLPVNDGHRAPAVLHDYLYARGVTSRAAADLILLRAMLDLGLDKRKAGAIYAGVRLGGWVAWRDHATRRQRGANEV